MRSHKKVILWSFTIMLLSIVVAIVLEWKLEKNILTNSIFLGHRNFVINILLGIFASAFLAYITALITYLSLRFELLCKYVLIAGDVSYESKFLLRFLKGKSASAQDKKYYTFDLELLLCDVFQIKFRSLQKKIEELETVGQQFAIICIPIISSMRFAKTAKMMQQVGIHLKYIFDVSNEMTAIMKYLSMMETSDDKSENDTMNKAVRNHFQKFVDLIIKENDFENSPYGELQNEYSSYFKRLKKKYYDKKIRENNE
ncbi:hypothetical protein [Frisingicoccus sp.]|uniref:hypothetical protein n=1 Tax=Frisingicoccus sp. TaxID=1918627 RepID=UPI003AB1C828